MYEITHWLGGMYDILTISSHQIGIMTSSVSFPNVNNGYRHAGTHQLSTEAMQEANLFFPTTLVRKLCVSSKGTVHIVCVYGKTEE